MKNTSDVINAAKMISESGSRMDVLARLIANQVGYLQHLRRSPTKILMTLYDLIFPFFFFPQFLEMMGI